MLPHESFKLLQQEGYLFQSCLTRGLTALRNANDSEKGNFDVAFFQLSIGLERLMKSAIVVHYMANNGLKPPSEGMLKSLGHRLLDLYAHISSMTMSEPNPLREVDTGGIAFDILRVLDNFARSSRYFNLDSLSITPSSCDPLSEYENVLQRILVENVKPKTVAKRVSERSAIASAVSNSSMAIDLSVQHESPDETLQRMFVKPNLQDLAAKHAVYHVLVLIDALKRFIADVSHAAHVLDRAAGNSRASIPYMHEFLEFAWLDRSYIFRKKQWP